MATTGGAEEAKHDETDITDDDVVIDAELQQLSKFTKLISPLFLVYGLFALICSILSMVQVDGADGWVTFSLVVVATIIFSLLAALGIYKWGTVEEQIEMFKEENNKYQEEIDRLKSTREQLTGEVEKLEETTNGLKRDVDTLKGTLGQYDELKNSLQEICGDNEELNNLINDVNGMYDSMKSTILSNTRAGILSAYYTAALKDDDEGMTKKEYRRFLSGLDKKTREVFKGFGTFEDLAGDDNILDLGEFQVLVDRLLAEQGDELILAQSPTNN